MSRDILEKQIEEYVIKYKENHYRLAYSYVKNIDDALDIIQESIYKAIASKDSLKEPRYMKTWFYRIIVNTSLDFLRKQNKLTVVDDETLEGFDSGTIDNYENFDLQRALDSLPENFRIVVILRYFEDLKLEEIAEVLKVNVNTVKARLYKSLDKLRIKMDDTKEV
ncbi:sigma-70 family RNA polymerase sigma factor [Candidatus Clostridium radicumherbarum]|uniref:Sigma-70 family RNA polymerase sigma factor n=1 Tax=Candidatus Clostridium radicumherbarum TaxID=3381662 RepID=A0ABW8TV04_9CLOT